MTTCNIGVVPETKHGETRDAYDNAVLRVAELEAAIRTAIRRFELLALANDELVNGVRPSVGAAELRALWK